MAARTSCRVSSDAWTPIGAEQTASGYRSPGRTAAPISTSVWNTDSNGNYVSSAVGVVSGSSAALKSSEIQLQQDLSGDGDRSPRQSVSSCVGRRTALSLAMIWRCLPTTWRPRSRRRPAMGRPLSRTHSRPFSHSWPGRSADFHRRHGLARDGVSRGMMFRSDTMFL